jgi:hypothetical protein
MNKTSEPARRFIVSNIVEDISSWYAGFLGIRLQDRSAETPDRDAGATTIRRYNT